MTPATPSSRVHWAWAVALVAIWFVLSWWRFEPAFLFHGDHERDLRYATLLVEHGVWPESTPSISPTPFELGPMLYFIMAPGVFASADPIGVRMWFLLLASAGFLLLYGCWTRRMSPPAARIALFGLLASSFTFEMSRQLWHSSLLPLFVAGFFVAAERLIRGEHVARNAALAAVCAAIAVQLHLTACVYVALGLGLVAWRRRGALPGLGAGLIALVPMLLTAYTSIQRGALDRLGASVQGGRWSPAALGEVLEFFVDNVHTIWGDDVGPLFTWPLIALALVGCVQAVRTGDGFARLLLINLILGFVVESLLLGNQRAHRYMHANLWATFGLVGFGVEYVLGHIKPWVGRPVVFGLAVVIVGEAFLSEVPHAHDRGWFNTREQQHVAAIVARETPLSDDEMERRVHGIYFGETMGFGHYHALQHLPEEPETFSDSLHVLVTPNDVPLALADLAPVTEHRIAGNERAIRVLTFAPRITDVEFPPGLQSRWRESERRSYAPGWHRITGTVTRRAELLLLLSRSRGGRDHCNVLIEQATRIRPVEARTPRYPELRILRFRAEPGPLTISLGPCPTPRFVDLF